ncbi:putative thioesterase (yiiD_Cterm domain) [Arcobacter venerupis]|uniref:Thioesterase (YiiD_Cterm domain) n=1 Tax=Arcobacter venerupis TaxID=1054033 RepID=A0AAE7E494_9BACT|nr:YiiD C-terminal domain-containing protein [Arcobacter venerupis]QKF66772.1 putative thioesterase (yiiD_Cterm domain) [Arcobacter venerupis]RWS49769.1 thioesterase [Arcobacter venerupis]
MIQELQNKLYNEIPLTKMMELQIKDYNINELITTVPLEPNINDKGTAFGGSLSTLSIISAWSLCWLISKELGFDSNNIVIIKNETSFRKPVTNDIICHTKKPLLQEIKILKQKLENKKSASIKIESQIIEEGKICVDFVGYYVIKV